MWYEGSGTIDRRYMPAVALGSIVSIVNDAGTVFDTNARGIAWEEGYAKATAHH